jgi:hypothetical protein
MSQLFENYYNDNTCTIEPNNINTKEVQTITSNNEDIYVITIDDKPYFYQTNLEEARAKLLDISKQLNNKINENDYYDSYICQKLEDEIIIVNQLDFVLFTKNYPLHSVKIHKVVKF